jgi:hypothetical protein
MLAAIALAAGSAVASPTLQIDVNALGIQAQNAGGGAVAFGGLTHTGSLAISYSAVPPSNIAGVFIDGVNQNFNGTLTGFAGIISLNSGQVTGGSFLVTINGGADTYSCQVAAVGQVATSQSQGGFTIDGLTFNGAFSDNLFGNVNVTPWNTGNLPGSYLQFNFSLNAGGAGFADLDIFVDVVPLPPAAWTGLATLVGLAGVGFLRRRR